MALPATLEELLGGRQNVARQRPAYRVDDFGQFNVGETVHAIGEGGLEDWHQ